MIPYLSTMLKINTASLRPTLLVAAMLLSVSLCNGWTAEASAVPIRIQDTTFPAELEMIVRRGSSGEVVPLHSDKPLELSLEEGGAYVAKADGLEVRGEILPGTEGRLSEWKADFQNIGSQQLLLEVELRWHAQSLDAQAQFWNGSYAAKPVSEMAASERFDNIKRMTPLAAIMHRERAVMAGLHPRDLRSYVASEWNRAEDGQVGAGFVTRVVIEPNQTVPVHFLFGGLPVTYGFEREVIQRVHNTASEAFLPDPKVHPSLYGSSAQYWVTRLVPEKIPASAVLELLRRYHATWDWDYAPFKRTGDLWGHEELWDYKPDIPFEKKIRGVIQSNLDFSKVDRKTFLEMREHHFNRNRGRDGLYFFMPGGTWMEKTLADTKHADARIIDENFRYELTQWVTGYDREVKVLPWFTSYEEVLKEDWKRIVATYDICGVALDVCRGGPRYRGPAIEKPIPYRAWDEKGVFIDQGIGIAKLIDFLHTLHPRTSPEHVLAIYGNPEVSGATYMTAARYDGGMFEGPPYHPSSASLPLQRYLLGKKPLSWWAGWMYTRYGVPNFKNFDAAHFVKTMQGLSDYVVFRSFELAGIPTLNYQHGVPAITAIIPDLLEAIRLGWEAVVPIRYQWEGQLHTARYGTGVGSLLFYGNPYDDARPFEVKIDNARMGAQEGESLIFAPWRVGVGLLNPIAEGTKGLTNILHDGTTRIAFPMLSREPILHRAVAAIKNPPQDLQATASVQRDDYQIRVDIQLANAGKSPLQITLPEYPNLRLEKVLVQGQPLPWIGKGNRIALAEISPAKTGDAIHLEIIYRSAWLNLTREDVQSFHLLDDNAQPTFDVVIEGDLEEEPSANMAAEKLRQYAAFYAAVNSKQPASKVAVYRQGQAPEAKSGRIHLKVDPQAKEAGVWLEKPGLILVQGRNNEETEESLGYLLGALDEFYPYTPGFIATWGMAHDLLKHTGMDGKILPMRKNSSVKPQTTQPIK